MLGSVCSNVRRRLRSDSMVACSLWRLVMSIRMPIVTKGEPSDERSMTQLRSSIHRQWPALFFMRYSVTLAVEFLLFWALTVAFSLARSSG